MGPRILKGTLSDLMSEMAMKPWGQGPKHHPLEINERVLQDPMLLECI